MAETDLVDGSVCWSEGVDSQKVTTIASDKNPNGLKRSQLAWLINGTVRDGGISPRPSWNLLFPVHPGTALYQGGEMYDPQDGSDPYLVVSIGGLIYAVSAITGAVTLLTTAGLENPPAVEQAYFLQAERFLIIQAGDGVTLPLFWDGATLRRSNGITGSLVGPNINEIPAATAMDYFMGRVWYAQGRNYSAGDIVYGPSGTAAYDLQDSLLKVTENPLCFGGDGFTPPGGTGNIRALKHNANLDAALGEGKLFIFTRKAVFSLSVPVTRNNWIAATSANQPLQTVIQLVNGAVGERSIVPVNGDLFYCSLEPGIRSLFSALRYFTQWGNREISANERRILQYADRALLHGVSGITFDNRLLMGTLPKLLPQGIVSQAIVPMDFIPISSFGSDASPNWEGMWEGLDHLQLFTGNFGGRERAFSLNVSREDSTINLWEISKEGRFDTNKTGENRITMQTEFPAFTWGRENLLKKCVTIEIWVDRVYGEVVFTMEWRPDSDPCWQMWHKWKICTARTCEEDVFNPCGYPVTGYGDAYRSTMVLPTPPKTCMANTGRPGDVAYQIQPRLTVKGAARIRGIYLHAEPRERKLYEIKIC